MEEEALLQLVLVLFIAPVIVDSGGDLPEDGCTLPSRPLVAPHHLISCKIYV